jgi:Fe-S oxidoreductase
VLHHSEVLSQLIDEGNLVATNVIDKHVTYHDPCYLGRHNGVYNPPRELIKALPGVTLEEMPRHGSQSFCCGAGGARMWTEERTGTRINLTRTTEAVATGAHAIAVGCPFCRVMLSDGLTTMQGGGEAPENAQVADVAQMLLAAVKRTDTGTVPPTTTAPTTAPPRT